MIHARAVLFDLDDTLFDRSAALRRTADAQALGLGPLLRQTPPACFVERLLALEALGYLKRMAIYRQLVHEFALDAGHRRLHPRRLTDDLLRRYPEHPVAAEGALPTLRALRQRGLRLAVVTNGRAPLQHRKLAALGLLELLDAVLVSEHEGVAKPDSALFHRALDRLGVPAFEALHVGHHPIDDVAASRAAGLKACWLRRPGQAAHEPEADATVDRLPELLQLLA